jgi:DNA-binding transcriptional ArsR family regulator
VSLKQSVTSLHLTILRATKIVDTRRDGRNIYYSINRERITEVMEAAKHLAGERNNISEITSLDSPTT